MGYFSFLDTTFRRIFFNFDSHLTVEGRQFYEEFLKSFENSSKQKAALINYLKDEILKNDIEFWILHAHEYNHFVQTFFYPYLYLMSYFQFKAFMEFPIQVRATEEDINLDDIKFITKINENFQIGSHKIPFYWNGNDIEIGEPVDQKEKIRWFCLNDFIENATSIFQFQFVNDNADIYNEYYKWVTNPSNRVYKNIYLFLVEKVGKATAYNMIRKITQVMFRCTDPIPMFRSIVNYWIDKHNDEEDLDLEYLELISKSGCQDDKTINVSDLYSVFELPEKKYLGYEEFQDILSQTTIYPISHLCKYFLDKNNVYKEFNSCLIDIDKEKFFKLYYNDYPPHLTQYFFEDEKIKFNPVVEVNNDYFNIDVVINEKKVGNFYSVLNIDMKIADISFEIIHSKSNDLIPMNCSFIDCPYYKLKLCRSWKAIPKKYHDCSFPYFFKMVFHKEIDVDNRRLKQIEINEEQLEKEYAEKLDIHNAASNLNYTVLSDRIILDVPVDELDNDPSSYFNLFISKLIEEKKYNQMELFNYIFIHFMGHDDDKREIYEIPKIVTWINNLKESVPELFYYLNWDIDSSSKPKKSQPTVMLPMFVKYIKHSEGFEFTENIYEFLIDKQILDINTFCKKNKLDSSKIILDYTNNILTNINLNYDN